MVTGQDADWHYLNNPGPANFDNPQGFLIDSINWSGSGTGMGAIFLGGADVGDAGTGMEQYLPGGAAALGPNTGFGSNTVDIPAAFASFPINSGLTSAGLSNWNTSAHDSWDSSNPSTWTAINTDGGPNSVTLVTNGGSGGLTPGGGAVPEPASVTLAGIGLVALLGYARRRRQRAEAA
jgi:hypothetical protein